MQDNGDDRRSTGWEYTILQVDEPASYMTIVQHAVARGLPENGGWELIVPWQMLPTGGAMVLFKRPMSAILTATTVTPEDTAAIDAALRKANVSPMNDRRRNGR